LAATGMIANLDGGGLSSIEDVSGKYPNKPKPKGTKEYFFNRNGEFRTDKMRKDECVFICYAINDISAIKKFNRWQQKLLL
jgi:hypothetical protein